MKRANFATIKYQPYANRSEHVNVGIITWSSLSELPKVHLPANLKKVKCLDPSVDLANFRANLESIPELINSLGIEGMENQYNIIASLGHQMSDLDGMIGFQNESEYFDKVARMMQSIVSPNRPIQQKRQADNTLTKDLKTTFKVYGWLGDSQHDIDNHLIVPRYSLAIDEPIEADFALMNGSLNIIEVIDLRNGITSAKKNEARGKALVCDYSKEYSQQSNSYAIMAGAESDSSSKPITKLINRYADNVIHYESHEDMNSFLNEISIKLERPLLDLPIS